MNWLHDLIIYLMAAFVLLGSVCRIKAMHPTKNKLSWAAMYVVMAAFALSAALDAQSTTETNYANVFGLVAWCLNLLNTFDLWEQSTPPATRKDDE